MRTHEYENDNPIKAALRLFRHNVRDEFALNSYDSKSGGIVERMFRAAADLLTTDEDVNVTQQNILQSYAERAEDLMLKYQVDDDDIEARMLVLEWALKGETENGSLPINRVTGEPLTAEDLAQFMETDYLGYQRHGKTPAEQKAEAAARGEIVDGRWVREGEVPDVFAGQSDEWAAKRGYDPLMRPGDYSRHYDALEAQT